WEEAQAIAMRLMDEQARAHGFTVSRPVELTLDRASGLYRYRIRSSRDIGDKYGQTTVWFDAYSGTLRSLDLPTSFRAGNTLTTWLYELHKANLFGLPYKIFVCVFGLAIVMLSVTGVYVWWKKWMARLFHGRRE
ncbi:PepSY-associated TM helix domain-containing protein, partial [Methylosinus sp. R-45379]|uniref:PepSY-associated TM helix domain-containing protein n=1 Tax=Methylosinus sp. R-45379 TaxID=980563 RepID=UPI000AC0B76E